MTVGLFLLLVGLSFQAQAFDQGAPFDVAGDSLFGPMDDAKAKVEEKKAAKDSAAEARLKALEQARSGKNARILVLKWANTDVGADNATLQRNIKTRIARPDAEFFPSIDLYQVGRRQPGRNLKPSDEPGFVPDESIEIIKGAVRDIEQIPWNGMSESDWGITAMNLKALAEAKIWFVDRVELREPLFLLYAQIGRAAENQNNGVPPFYESVAGHPVNYFWYLAAAMAHEDPSLMSALTNQDISGSIGYYKEMLDTGELNKVTLAFEMEDRWDPAAFTAEYQVYVNGLEHVISDKDSFLEVPPGIIDIYLKRSDGGHSLSDRVTVSKLQDKIYFVRDVARKKMGIDLIDQLMEHPNECTPELDGETMHYITIYGRLHPKAEVYVAVPEAGNPNKVMLWRFDRKTDTLQKVLDDVGSFPVHFVATAGVGTAFNGAGIDTTAKTQDDIDICIQESGGTPEEIRACALPAIPTPSISPSGVPIIAQLRVHYGRAFVSFGMEHSIKLGGGKWEERYQIQQDGVAVTKADGSEAYQSHTFSRLTYGGLGVVLKSDAVYGIGPRAWLRVGKYNAPNALDLTAHVGMTIEPPGKESATRTRFVMDVDFFGGALVPVGDSLMSKGTASFGLSAGAGLTF